MELTGKVKEVFDLKTGDKFKKKEFLLEYEDGTYTRTLLLQCMGDKVDILNGIYPGDTVFVKFNAESRKNNDRWFTNCTCWFIKKS